MIHIPVLLKEAIAGLDIDSGDIFVDCTLGGGGHSKYVAELFGSGVRIVGIDLDRDAIERSKENLKDTLANIEFVEDSFRNIESILDSLEIKEVDKILLDIGVSSNQIEESGRGFSFKRNEPLIMTMSKPSEKDVLTAYEIVNYWSPEEIADVIKNYGEERFARRIAGHIETARKEKKIETTDDLVEIILKATPKAYHHGRIHPATRTFQALRIAVNDELKALEEALIGGFKKLSKEGRMAVISFHSLEDRIVKNFFRDLAKEEKALLINKKPITPSDEEILANPRSRSAKLRIIEKK